MESHTRTNLSKGAFPEAGKQAETCIETESGPECTRRKDEWVQVSRLGKVHLWLQRETGPRFALQLQGYWGRCAEKLYLKDE